MTVCWAFCGDIQVKYSHLEVIMYECTLVAENSLQYVNLLINYRNMIPSNSLVVLAYL